MNDCEYCWCEYGYICRECEERQWYEWAYNKRDDDEEWEDW